MKLLLNIYLALALLSPSHIQNTGDEIVGTWYTSTKNAKVSIFKTGNMFYGKIIWLKNPNEDDNKPKVDKNNPDEKLRSRHISGMLILKSFEFNTSDNNWQNGEIYDPKNGKTYSCKLTLSNQNTLEVRGFIGISLIGRTEVWTRTE
ncbi:MAG: DUF2147 domain-containing protein [Bacteroidota bacterium]